MFGWKRSLYVCLETSKDKGFENFVELRNEFILFVIILDIEIEPFIKLLRAFKDLYICFERGRGNKTGWESNFNDETTTLAIIVVYLHRGRESLIAPIVHAGKQK